MKTFFLKTNNKLIRINRNSLCDVIEIAKLKYKEWEIYSTNYKKLAYSNPIITIGALTWKSAF